MAGAVETGYAKDAGVPQAQLVVLPDQSSLLAAVQAGRADAAALTALSIADMAKKGEGVDRPSRSARLPASRSRAMADSASARTTRSSTRRSTSS